MADRRNSPLGILAICAFAFFEVCRSLPAGVVAYNTTARIEAQHGNDLDAAEAVLSDIERADRANLPPPEVSAKEISEIN